MYSFDDSTTNGQTVAVNIGCLFALGSSSSGSRLWQNRLRFRVVRWTAECTSSPTETSRTPWNWTEQHMQHARLASFKAVARLPIHHHFGHAVNARGHARLLHGQGFQQGIRKAWRRQGGALASRDSQHMKNPARPSRKEAKAMQSQASKT